MKHEMYLKVAEEITRFSKCLKGNWGAIVVRDDMVVGCGYNGPARGIPHCNPCKREDYPKGERYDLCPACHAEVNSLLQAGGRAGCLGATLYLGSWNRKPEDGTAYNAQLGFFPCDNCWKYIINAGIKTVVLRGLKGIEEVDVEWAKTNRR